MKKAIEMQMTNEEIVRSYKEAADKKEQIKILAEFNLVSKEEIRKILIEGGSLFSHFRARRAKSLLHIPRASPCENRRKRRRPSKELPRRRSLAM